MTREDYEKELSTCILLGLSETWLTSSTLKLPLLFKDMKYIIHPASKEKAVGRPSGGLVILYNPRYIKDLNN